MPDQQSSVSKRTLAIQNFEISGTRLSEERPRIFEWHLQEIIGTGEYDVRQALQGKN